MKYFPNLFEKTSKISILRRAGCLTGVKARQGLHLRGPKDFVRRNLGPLGESVFGLWLSLSLSQSYRESHTEVKSNPLSIREKIRTTSKNV